MEDSRKIIRRHPWEAWFEGASVSKVKYLELTRGVDFDCEVHNMAVQIRNRARATGYLVSIQIHGDRLLAIVRRKSIAKTS